LGYDKNKKGHLKHFIGQVNTVKQRDTVNTIYWLGTTVGVANLVQNTTATGVFVLCDHFTSNIGQSTPSQATKISLEVNNMAKTTKRCTAPNITTSHVELLTY
jgi:hypothetical protein